jgi:hypothetical protein
MYRVTFYDLSGYGENVILATNAPVYDVIIVDSFDAAFQCALDYGDEFQVSIEEVK